jgi:hypothetical protein
MYSTLVAYSTQIMVPSVPIPRHNETGSHCHRAKEVGMAVDWIRSRIEPFKSCITADYGLLSVHDKHSPHKALPINRDHGGG